MEECIQKNSGTTGCGLDYDTAIKRVMSLVDFERAIHSPGHSGFHLERMGLLMDRLGHPYLRVPTIHIAGTKGKGSTAAMVTSILTAAGYKTGLYTSPALHSVTERIRVGLEPIDQKVFANLVDCLWSDVEWVGKHGGYKGITFFEMLTAMAFVHFAQIEADYQVVEVGLGGRLDATNVVCPEICVIMPIFLDHVGILGNTLALIAGEKAGIIKPGVPVVVAPQPDEATDVFLKISKERDAPLIQVDRELKWKAIQADTEGQSFDVDGLRGKYRLWTPLLGDFQLENAATAIATVETLVERGLALSSNSVVEGLRQTNWPARLQVISDEGGVLVVVDGAHNPDSVRRLTQEIKKHFHYLRVILVFGANGDHNIDGMITELASLSPTVVVVRSRHPKSAPAKVIANAARKRGMLVAHESEDISLATREALRMAEKSDLVLGTGSLAVAAEIIEEIKGLESERYPYLERLALKAM